MIEYAYIICMLVFGNILPLDTKVYVYVLLE